MIFGLFDKKPQLVTPDMIKPVNEPVPTSQAKAIYRSYMLEIEFLDKQEISDHVEYFADAIRDRTDELKGECEESSENIKFYKEQIRDSKLQLKNADSEERESLQCDIEMAEDDIKDEQVELDKYKKALADFKVDKRQFLVKYINDELSR